MCEMRWRRTIFLCPAKKPCSPIQTYHTCVQTVNTHVKWKNTCAHIYKYKHSHMDSSAITHKEASN